MLGPGRTGMSRGIWLAGAHGILLCTLTNVCSPATICEPSLVLSIQAIEQRNKRVFYVQNETKLDADRKLGAGHMYKTRPYCAHRTGVCCICCICAPESPTQLGADRYNNHVLQASSVARIVSASETLRL